MTARERRPRSTSVRFGSFDRTQGGSLYCGALLA